ncbi:MAG: RidA family protein [Proteobacteria bacterium]|nr:RidA family protein [Pseudomonadota bacterium]
MSTLDVTVESWPRPRGYSNGRIGVGRALHVAGQIGWTPAGTFVETTLLGQFGQALDNVLAVVRAAGGVPTDIATMTIYVTSIVDYRAMTRQLGPTWKARMGAHYPAMALVQSPMLVEEAALVEIQAVAYLDQTGDGT